MEIEKKSAQLELDIQELEQFVNKAQRSNVKFILQNTVQTLKTELNKQLALEKLESEPKKIEENKANTKKNVSYQQISGYSWEQENNHVKIYISLEKIGELAKDKIVCDFQDQAFDLKIHDFQNKNLRLFIKKLNDKIEIKSCKCNQRKNMIILDLLKGTSKFWDQLEFKESPIGKKDPKEDLEKGGDPQASLMNMMKKMYQEGDDEMKKTIAQAWQKSQDEKDKKDPSTL